MWEHVEAKTDVETLTSRLLWKYLLGGLRAVEKAYCVVDALDDVLIRGVVGIAVMFGSGFASRPVLWKMGTVGDLMVPESSRLCFRCGRINGFAILDLLGELVEDKVSRSVPDVCGDPSTEKLAV